MYLRKNLAADLIIQYSRYLPATGPKEQSSKYGIGSRDFTIQERLKTIHLQTYI